MSEKSKKYKVSVCVPVYNVEPYLKECLDSLLNQTLKEIEIVCVNDGSTDNSLAILEDYASHNANIKVISQKNQGLGGARNTGIKNASGEYIGFIDADDLADKDMYKLMYEAAKREHAEIAMCNVEFYPPNVKTKKGIWYKPYNGKMDADFLQRNVQPSNKIVLRQLIEKTNFQFYEKNGDGMFAILMLYADNIASIDKKCYKYRIGHSSMSTNYKLENFEISVECAKKMLLELQKTKYKDSLRKFFEYNLFYSLIQVIAVSALKGDKEKFYYYKKELKNLHYKCDDTTINWLQKRYSKLTCYGIVYVLPINYYISRLLTKKLLKH